MKLHRGAHTVYKTQYHIVWVVRYRRKVLVEGVAKYLRVKLLEVQKYYPDWQFTEICWSEKVVAKWGVGAGSFGIRDGG